MNTTVTVQLQVEVDKDADPQSNLEVLKQYVIDNLLWSDPNRSKKLGDQGLWISAVKVESAENLEPIKDALSMPAPSVRVCRLQRTNEV